jgi:hypothetical protein
MWGWLENERERHTWGFVFRVVMKAGALFALCNLIYAFVNPMLLLGQISLYGTVYPARERLPYAGDNGTLAYNLSVDNLDAMFASHEITQRKGDDEFRVVLVGDSATWGWFLEPDKTYAAQVNAAEVMLDDGRQVVAYNLGYPVLSITKDLVILDRVQVYAPDMVVWLVTAQSLRYVDERGNPVQAGPPIDTWPLRDVMPVVERYDLPIDVADDDSAWWERTIVGQRRDLANLLRLQVYGGVWGATGIDHYIPNEYVLRRSDLFANEAWANFEEPTDIMRDDLAFDVLAAGSDLMDEVPVVIVNEPMFISAGENSDLRYNSFYPRWAYDAYRELMTDLAVSEGWAYYDWWDVLPPDQFTDTPVHITPEAAAQLGEMLTKLIIEEASQDG